MARNPLPRSNFGTASLVERRDSLPDVELEEGLSADVDIQDESIIQAPGLDIELEEDGGVVINFDPSDISPGSSDFHANLAEDLSDRAASRISSDLIGCNASIACRSGNAVPGAGFFRTPAFGRSRPYPGHGQADPGN